MQINSIYILGDHIQALGITRLAKNIANVTIFNDYYFSVARFSKYCDKFIGFHDEADLFEKLLNKYAITKHKAILIPTNDKMVHFIIKNFDELKNIYIIPYEDIESIETCYNKKETYKKAFDLKIPFPATHFPTSEKHLKDIISSLIFPVILKPAIMHSFFKKTKEKVIFCKTEDALLSGYKKMSKIIPKEEIMIQEFLEGGAKNLYSFGAFSVKGEIYGGFTVNRIRQKPMDFGASTTFALTVNIPEIMEISMKYLKGINYTGVAELEFMYDQNKAEYKLLEVNPRFWKWHYIGNKLKINFIDMLIKYFSGDKMEKHIENIENIGWEERVTDYYIITKELLNRQMSFKDVINSLKLKKQFAVWSWNDPLPGLMYLLFLPFLFIKRA